jgi:N utilization substance protein A
MINFGNVELLQIIDAVAREKGINREHVAIAIEQAIQVAGRRKYGQRHNIKAVIDRRTGEVHLSRLYEVVENVENEYTEISLKDAQEKDKSIALGAFISEALPPIDLGRVAAQAAKQVIMQKVKDAELERQYEEYKDRIGQIMNGVVKRVEYGDVIIDFGRDEAILRRNAQIPNENFKHGDRVRVLIEDLNRHAKSHQIIASRTSDQFMAQLFAQEVPEIYDGVIEIKAVAREPGSRAKIAVFSSENSLDPVGSCVGVRGSRVQAVIAELQGEKIDIIQWSADPAIFIVNALSPAEVTKVVIDEDTGKAEVVVPTEQLSLAIGRRGQNVRLASRLSGWKIDVMTEEQESKKRVEEFTNATEQFMNTLNVEEVIAQLLASAGFSSVREIAFASIKELSSIDGFDDEISEAIIARAKDYVAEHDKDVIAQLNHMGVEQDLILFLDLPYEDYLKIAEIGVKSLDDLGEMTPQEMLAVLPNGKYNRDTWQQLIAEVRSNELSASKED